MKLNPYPEYKDSGVPWLGKIPEHWRIIRSGYLFKEIVDTGHPELELLSITIDKGIIRQYDSGRKTRASEDRFLYKHIKKGELGYNLMNAFMGGIGISRYEGILSPAYAVGKPCIDMDPWYYHFLYRSPIYMNVFDMFSYGIMYERNRLYYDRFKTITVPYPPLNEQRAIHIFIRTKNIGIINFIQGKRRLIELLKEQKQAIINRAVTRGLDPGVRLKPSGIDWLGHIPEHWEVRRLKTIAKVKLSGVDKNSVDGETLVSLCNYVDVYKNDQITGEINFMKATAIPAEIFNFELKSGDVIITKDSESWDDIAVPAYVPNSLPGVICAYHLALIRPNYNLIIGEYLFRAFYAEVIAYQFRVSANGVTRYGLSQNAIKDALFPVPPIKEQIKITGYINDKISEIDTAILRAEREIELIREYRTRLIADVVTGKVDVRDFPVPETPGIEEPGEFDSSLETAEPPEPANLTETQENPDENPDD